MGLEMRSCQNGQDVTYEYQYNSKCKKIQIQTQTTIVNANTQKESGLVVGRGSCPHGQDLNQEYPASCCILQPKLSHSQNFHTAETLDVFSTQIVFFSVLADGSMDYTID